MYYKINKFKLIFLMLLFACSVFAQKEENDNSYNGNLNIPERQEWVRDLGFGMFIHFNVDAELGITISHSLVGASEDYIQRYYTELPKIFDPKKFDAYQIAKLAKLAGMKYVVFTTKHHSGFCFWNTKTTDFKITNTAYKKDLLKEYVKEIRKAGLAVGLYYSPEDFKFLHHNDILIQRGDIKFDKKTSMAYDDLVRKQTEELFSHYGKIDILFIDGEPKEPCKEVAWRIQPSVVITRGAINSPEQTLPGVALDQFWESCVTMGTQWNYKPTNDNIKSAGRIIELLVESRAKGGNLLLNIGPHPEGYIPYEQEKELREVAAWNFINHEAIENTRPWIVVQEGNIWFTASKDKKTLYAVLSKLPNWKRGDRKEFVLGSLRATSATKISVLGQNSKVIEYQNGKDAGCYFSQKEDGLHISVVRAQRIYDNNEWPNPIVVKLENIEPALDPPVIETLGAEQNSNTITLKANLVKKGSNSEAVKIRFDYRPYKGFSGNLYSTDWTESQMVGVRNEAEYSIELSNVEKGIEYEYRAVLIHPQLTVNSTIKRFTLK